MRIAARVLIPGLNAKSLTIEDFFAFKGSQFVLVVPPEFCAFDAVKQALVRRGCVPADVGFDFGEVVAEFWTPPVL